MGDNNFYWYYGAGPEPEVYYGKCATREDVLLAAAKEYPEGDFTIVEADGSVANTNIFDADYVMERYEECNEECWGEDGMQGFNSTAAQDRDLEKMLAETLEAWFQKHGTRPAPWAFGTTRNEQYFPFAASSIEPPTPEGKMG